MRTFNVLLGIQAAIETKEGLDDGRGGDLVDEAAQHLVRSADKELAELYSLHQVILVTVRDHADEVSQRAVGGRVAHLVFTTHGVQSPAPNTRLESRDYLL